MAGDQEGDDLVADVGRVQGGAVGGVRGAEHQAEKVLGAALVGAGAGGDDVVHDLGEVVGVRPEGRVGRRVVGARGAGQPGHAPLQTADHRLHEGMRLGALERPEVVVESGESDGVEGHPGHVVGHVDGPAGPRRTVPGVDEPPGHLQHHGVVGAHRAERERGHQDVVRLRPVGLVVVRREQAVGGELAHVLQGGPDVLGEPLLVGQIGDQVRVGDEHHVPPVQPPHQHRAVLPHQFHDLLDGRAAGAGGGDVDDGDAGQGSGRFGAQCGGGHGAATAFRGNGRTAFQGGRRARGAGAMALHDRAVESSCRGLRTPGRCGPGPGSPRQVAADLLFPLG